MAINARIEADMREAVEAVAKIEDPELVRPALKQLIAGVLERYGLLSQQAAQEWFETLIGYPAIVPAISQTKKSASVIAQSIGPLIEARNLRQASALGARWVGRRVDRNGRDVIHASVEHYKDVYWARVLSPGDNCDFCIILASRGPVYGSSKTAAATADGKRYHENCHCSAVPLKGRWVIDPSNPRGTAWVGDRVAGVDFDELYAKEYKPYWRKNDSIEHVVKRRREALRAAGKQEVRAEVAAGESVGAVSKVKRRRGSKRVDFPLELLPASSPNRKNGVIYAPPEGGWPAGRGTEDEPLWAKRQSELRSETNGEFLSTLEIESLERLEKHDHYVNWIPRPPHVLGVGRKASNDFYWTSNKNIEADLKTTSTKWGTISKHLLKSIVNAKEHHVIKENFILDFQGVEIIPAKVMRYLREWNTSHAADRQIKELWIMWDDGRQLLRIL
ncbi:hypothetical protein [Trueperella sp. LYQ141]|uniref:VG15 protein n=1 Tax=Trueperella sp. LYQ141 TaxID=3391058 RepID=UPI0039832CCA